MKIFLTNMHQKLPTSPVASLNLALGSLLLSVTLNLLFVELKTSGNAPTLFLTAGADLGGGVRWVRTNLKGPKNFYVHIISPFVNAK